MRSVEEMSREELESEAKYLRAQVEQYERLFCIGFEPWTVKYAPPARFAMGDSPGYWYVVASNRRGLGYASSYLQRDGSIQMHCQGGHFDTEEEARAMLAAVTSRRKGVGREE